ncbi:unnamed protein product, partial [Ilex paraguariensis]
MSSILLVILEQPDHDTTVNIDYYPSPTISPTVLATKEQSLTFEPMSASIRASPLTDCESLTELTNFIDTTSLTDDTTVAYGFNSIMPIHPMITWAKQ